MKIKAVQNRSGNELYICDRKIDSKAIARLMEKSDSGFHWGSTDAKCDQTAFAICIVYMDNIDGGRELFERFKEDFVKDWKEGQDIELELDMEGAYGDFRDQFWKEWWEEIGRYYESHPDQED